MNVQELYPDVPPTKLRNQDEKFRPAKTSPFWLWVANMFFYNMLENRFFALRYKGEENFHKRDNQYPTIAFAPHTNWWDGIVGYNVVRRIFGKEIRLMVEELNRFPLLRRGGAFPVNKKSPQASMRALKYSVDVINDLGNVLYIFPQGIIKPPNYRPIEFQTGLAYIAEKAVKKYGKVNLMPIGVNYCFLRADKPEVMVDIAEPIILDHDIPRKDLSHMLENALETVCDVQMQQIANGQLEPYQTLFQQKLKWYRKIEQRLKKIEIKGSGV
ncbi:lysophospholipid acyltransferase family protein [bacterium]|nr:lysophospholipid acyltransferase family protein [bacterium]